MADKLYDFQVMKKSLTTFILILFSALSYAGTNDSLRPIQVGDSAVHQATSIYSIIEKPDSLNQMPLITNRQGMIFMSIFLAMAILM